MLQPNQTVLSVVLLITGSILAQDTSPLAIVAPTPSRDVVINPGKGWVLYGDAARHDERLLAVSNLGYRRFEWADLEPEEGQFDWEPIESFLAGWDKSGKQAAFGVMCLNSHTSHREGYTTPRWVFEAGSPKRVAELKDLKLSTTGTPGVKVIPTFNDPIFLDKLARFLAAMGRRFDGDRRVAFIDMRSYGNWGEGHMHPFGGEPITSAEFQHHIQLHLDAFQKTSICISCENKRSPHVAVYDWAVKEQRCVARRDGICGNSDGSELERAFGVAPAVFEMFGPYDFLKAQGWWYGRDKDNRDYYGHKLEDCVEIGKPSYIDLSRGGRSGLELLNEEPELVQRLANRMGYHFVLQEFRHPRTLSRAKPAEVTFQWRNAGVAPVYVPCQVALALIDAQDHIAAICRPAECQPKHWLPDKPVKETAVVDFPEASPGDYRLAVGLMENHEAPTPWIRLAIEGETVHGWHILGTVAVKP